MIKNKVELNPLEKVEILTLVDNYIEMTAFDNTPIVTRASIIKDGEVKVSIQAEHGFSAVIKTTGESSRPGTRAMLFDFGFSEGAAAYNAGALGVDMDEIEVLALSHGHFDHLGGFNKLVKMIGKKKLEIVLHPSAFKSHRYVKISGQKAWFPKFTKAQFKRAGLKIVEAVGPLRILGGDALFLGEVKRETDFEKGMPNAFYEENNVEKHDSIEDDSAIVMNLRGQGLIIFSGCAHSGIVNIVKYAQSLTGIDKVHVVMGGFHLSGPGFEPVIGRTIDALKDLQPDYIVPCHCTGRRAINEMEREIPGRFIMNMAGTKLTFNAW